MQNGCTGGSDAGVPRLAALPAFCGDPHINMKPRSAYGSLRTTGPYNGSHTSVV
jgi:hypothetical protein